MGRTRFMQIAKRGGRWSGMRATGWSGGWGVGTGLRRRRAMRLPGCWRRSTRRTGPADKREPAEQPRRRGGDAVLVLRLEALAVARGEQAVVGAGPAGEGVEGG